MLEIKRIEEEMGKRINAIHELVGFKDFYIDEDNNVIVDGVIYPLTEEEILVKIAENDEKEALQAEKDKLKAEKELKLKNGFITADGVMFFNEAFGYIFAETLSTALVLDEKTVTWKSAAREQIDIDIDTAKVYLKEIQLFLKSVHFVKDV